MVCAEVACAPLGSLSAPGTGVRSSLQSNFFRQLLQQLGSLPRILERLPLTSLPDSLRDPHHHTSTLSSSPSTTTFTSYRLPSSSLAVDMPSATVLLQSSPPAPPWGLVPNGVHGSSANNSAYEEIAPESLTPIDGAEVVRFRNHIANLPFEFPDVTPSLTGLYLESKADVRLFYQSSLVLPCWPLILTLMSRDGNEDLCIRSEKQVESCRPDISIHLMSGQFNATGILDPTSLELQHISLLEFKGPGSLFWLPQGDLLDVRNSDDWVLLSKQLRKYCVVFSINHLVVFDGVMMIYLEFTNSTDENSEVFFYHTSSSTGVEGLSTTSRMTVRELFVFSVYRSLDGNGLLRQISDPFPRLHKLTVCCREKYPELTQAALDYVAWYPEHTVHPALLVHATAASQSLRVLRGNQQYTLTICDSGFPRCAINARDITPPAATMGDSGVNPTGPRRSPPDFVPSGT